MLPIIAGIISSLVSANLPKVAQAITDRGLDYVEKKLGIKLEPDMTKEQLQAVAVEANKHEEFQIEQANKNTADARSMNTKVQEAFAASWLAKNTAYIIDFIIVLSAIGMTFLAFLVDMPLGNKDMVFIMVGSLWTLAGSVVNFHRGSSVGSKDKTALLNLKEQNELK